MASRPTPELIAQFGDAGRAPDHGLVEHWNGRKWSVVNLPVWKSGSIMLDAVVARGDQAWVAGEADSPTNGGRPFIAHWAKGKWTFAHLPSSAGSNWSTGSRWPAARSAADRTPLACAVWRMM